MPDLFHSLRVLEYVWTHIDWNEWAIQKRNIHTNLNYIPQKQCEQTNPSWKCVAHVHTCAKSHSILFNVLDLNDNIFDVVVFLFIFSFELRNRRSERVRARSKHQYHLFLLLVSQQKRSVFHMCIWIQTRKSVEKSDNNTNSNGALLNRRVSVFWLWLWLWLSVAQ